ncbi:hypothetical protein HK097_006767, partial [Rhizophlyctis rosea]
YLAQHLETRRKQPEAPGGIKIGPIKPPQQPPKPKIGAKPGVAAQAKMTSPPPPDVAEDSHEQFAERADKGVEEYDHMQAAETTTRPNIRGKPPPPGATQKRAPPGGKAVEPSPVASKGKAAEQPAGGKPVLSKSKAPVRSNAQPPAKPPEQTRKSIAPARGTGGAGTNVRARP